MQYKMENMLQFSLANCV